MTRRENIISILSLYDNKLPFSVAEYFCKIYLYNIVSRQRINYQLFKIFIDYKNDIIYNFEIVDADSEKYFKIKLVGLTIFIPRGKDAEFMDQLSNYIFTNFTYAQLEWEDGNDYLEKKNELSQKFVTYAPGIVESEANFLDPKYVAKCDIIF